MTRVLIVDDDAIVADSLSALLTQEGYDCATATDGQAALDMIADVQQRIDVLITDMDMPRCDGRELLKKLHAGSSGVVPLVLTGFGKIEDAVAAVKLGAANYLTKPVLDDDLKKAVDDAAQRRVLLSPAPDASLATGKVSGVPGLVAQDFRMQKVLDRAESVAMSQTPVLITGEPGAGQSLVAQFIHEQSPRREQPCVTLDCVGLDESEQIIALCGLARSAGADSPRSRPGIVSQAKGGTLIVSSLDKASPGLQRRLLQLVTDGTVTPSGSEAVRDTDVRLVLTADAELKPAVDAGTFREDLFYRINVVPMHVPALRDRPDDIAVLVEFHLEQYAERTGQTRTFSDEALAVMRAYDWPGNGPELEAAVGHAVTMSPRYRLEPQDLPDTATGSGAPAIRAGLSDAPAGSVSVPALADGWTTTPLAEALEEPERQIILAALNANDWNRSETARQLNVDRTTLYKKIKRFKLDQPPGF